jgi:DNA invertase Pin-like site-specific DNA recombinase
MLSSEPAPVKSIIGYARCSTQRQKNSGLGLEAQQFAIEQHAKMMNAVIVRIYVEAESGKKCDRVQLALALQHAKRIQAVIVFAKVDRLARNARFLLSIVESGADVIFADLPQVQGPMGKFLITQMAAIAELEGAMISARTKSALAEAKRRGTKLGSAREGAWTGNEARRLELLRAGNATRLKNAAAFAAQIKPLIDEMIAEGLPYAQIAARLNEQGHQSPRGKPFQATTVHRIASR